MIDLASIYRNPLLPPGYYFAKVVDVETENLNMDRPRIWVQVQIGSMHEPGAGLRLCSIIHPTEASRFYYKNFVQTFWIRGNRYPDAINRWASIELVPSQYGKTAYSAIKWTYQSREVRLQVNEIVLAEQDGGELPPMSMAV